MLTGQQYRQFTEALLDAYRSKQRLAEMLRFELNEHLEAIAMGDDLREIVFKLIQVAEAGGWTAKLIIAVRKDNPDNPRLFTFAQQFELAPVLFIYPDISTQVKPEAIIEETNSFLDVSIWLKKLSQIETQVCCIGIRSGRQTIRAIGTGFLVSSNLVMTNHHVLEAIQKAHRDNVIFRFDYKRRADGTTANPGTECHLAKKDWLVDSSPMSIMNGIYGMNTPRLPSEDELDYALLRIEGRGLSRSRGWIEIPRREYDFKDNTPLFIVQHPDGGPLQLALDTKAIIGVNDNRTRVFYRTNTLGGSSGSPCFNENWELVALHHGSDPDKNPDHKPKFNQGIPFTAILKRLARRGLLGLLGN